MTQPGATSQPEQNSPRQCFFCGHAGGALVISFHHHEGEKWLLVGYATDLIDQVERALRNPKQE